MAFPKIIHLSDIHLKREKNKRPKTNQRFEHIVNKLNALDNKAEHIIIITGDIVESVSKKMLSETCPTKNPYIAAKNLLDKIDTEFKKILIVPGNHDSGRKGFIGFSSSFFDSFSNTFSSFMGEPFNSFARSKSIAIDSSLQVETFPTCYEENDALFIGLNSMEGELKDKLNLWADGEIGDEQLDRLNILLEYVQKNNKKCVIYLHHHPFESGFYKALGDNDDFIELLQVYKDSVEAVLFGHNHIGAVHLNKYGIKRWYDAGSTTRKEKSNGYHKIIELNESEPIKDILYDFLDDYNYSNDEQYQEFMTEYD